MTTTMYGNYSNNDNDNRDNDNDNDDDNDNDSNNSIDDNKVNGELINSS